MKRGIVPCTSALLCLVAATAGDGYLTQNPAIKANPGLTESSGSKLIKSVKPVYPLGARRTQAQGAVKMIVRIDETGRPSEVHAITGPDVFRDAINAVKQWRYEPLEIDGVPIFVQILIIINFHMN